MLAFLVIGEYKRNTLVELYPVQAIMFSTKVLHTSLIGSEEDNVGVLCRLRLHHPHRDGIKNPPNSWVDFLFNVPGCGARS